MKKNYDSYNDDFNELSGNYKDLVNQPTMGDAFAEAFSKAGSNPAPGPQSAIANAILNGMSAGFKGSENVIRQQKLEPLYQMVAENTARAAEIRAQVQEAKQNELSFKKFADIATPTVAAWAEQVKNGDPRSNITFTGLIDQLSRTVPQFNKYTADHWNTAKGFGLLLNKETGEHLKISADEIMQAIAPRAKEIYGDRWFEKFDGLSAGLAKDAAYALNMQRQEDALGLEGKSADVALKQAHAGVYQQEAKKIQNEMANPVNQYQEKYNIQAALKNQDEVYKTITPKLEKQEQTLGMYDRLEDATDAATWTRGNSSAAAILRFLAKETGMDENIATADLTSLQMESTLKEMLGAAFGQEEGERILGKMVGPRKNYAAFKKQIEVEKDKLIKDIVKNKIRVATFAKERHANLEHPDLYTNLDNQIEDYKIETKRKTKINQNKTESGNQNLPSDEELGIKFY